MSYREWLVRLDTVELFRAYYESGGTLNPAGWSRTRIVDFILTAAKAGAQ